MKVIFDLDGTIALIEHRRHFVTGEKKDWRAFFAACVDDKPNRAVIAVMNIFITAGYKIVICSGRSDEVQDETLDWLRRYRVPFDCLWMRPAGDFTPDAELKQKWLDSMDKSQILCVFDDRDSVVKMWRDNGISCFQVAPGDF